MGRVRRPLPATDQRDIAERQTGRTLEPAERDALNEGQDLALEGGEVDELAVPLVPLAPGAFVGDVGDGATAGGLAVVASISLR
jgi:hypothetical protein